MVIGRPSLLACLALLGACGLEGSLGDAVGGDRFVEYVPAEEAPTQLFVRATARPGVVAWLGEASGTTDGLGEVELSIPAGVDLRFAIVRAGDLAAILPPGATAVALDDRTTADVRVLEALPGDLAAADGQALQGLLTSVRQEHGDVYEAVTRSLLGLPSDVEEALARAVEGRILTPCLNEGSIRVVFEVSMRDGMKDGSCAPIDRFRWAEDAPDASMFLAGDIHESFGGIAEADALRVRDLLGGFAPNLVPMREVSEGLWRLSLDLPRTSPPLRIGYKYTWGLKGAGWTGTEEWPGNQRLLEVVDVNLDGLVVRQDRFGDETTNKDKQNLRRGAVGAVSWDTDADGDGWLDAREGPVDSDGDCVSDGFPRAQGVAPLLGGCEDPAPPEPPVSGGGPVAVYAVAGNATNGGGDVVEIEGEGFTGDLGVTFGDEAALATFARGPSTLVAVTPPMEVEEAVVSVDGVVGPTLAIAGPGPEAPACRTSLGPPAAVGRAHAQRTTLTLEARSAIGGPISMELVVGPEGTPRAGWEGRAARGEGLVVSGGQVERAHAADLLVPPVGRWGFGFRVSGDGGRTWRYCADFGSFVVE